MEAINKWIRETFWGFGLAAIVFATLGQWEARYADPTELSLAGIAIALSLILVTGAIHRRRKWTMAVSVIVGTLLLLIGGGLLGIAVSEADHASWANDRRCLAIQHDMLSARPKRDDSPALFQALACRPQGPGSVYAPSRSENMRSIGAPSVTGP